MRVPGMHVLLTAGVITLLSVGTVSAFSMAGSGEAAPRLPQVAPPPAAAAPLVPAPLPAAAAPVPGPVVAAPTDEPEADTPTREQQERHDPPRTRTAPPKDEDSDRPDRPKVKPDRNGTPEQKLAWACAHGFDGSMCKQYE